MTGAGGMGVDGGIQWLVVGDPKATFSPVSDVFFFFFPIILGIVPRFQGCQILFHQANGTVL